MQPRAQGAVEPVYWRATEFVLTVSEPISDGVCYRVLESFSLNNRVDATSTLFAYLLKVTLDASPYSDLRRNLRTLPGWPKRIAAQPATPSACSRNIIYAAGDGWSDIADKSQHQWKLAAVKAGTRWLMAHCAKAKWHPDMWKALVRAGQTKLLTYAYHAGVLGYKVVKLRSHAFCAHNYDLFFGLTGDAKQYHQVRLLWMDYFFTCLAPRELHKKGDTGDARVLKWMLAHKGKEYLRVGVAGYKPQDWPIRKVGGKTPQTDALPVGVARALGRDDIAKIFIQAGAKPATLQGKLKQLWLQRRLDAVAGVEPPPLPSAQQDDNYRYHGQFKRIRNISTHGKPAYLVGSCGMHSCYFALMVRFGRDWKSVYSGGGYFKILKTRHHGWRDFEIRRHSVRENSKTIYHYNGDIYQSAICSSVTRVGTAKGWEKQKTTGLCQETG